VKHLERVGFLNGALSVAHAIWLDEAEIDLLRQHGVKVVHNPGSNMKLGSGIARIKKMLRQGVTVGLGADSVNAGTVYSIFEQMKLSVLLPRAAMAPEDWVFPEEALEMGTLGGAKALLLERAIGSIEEGKKADLVVLSPSMCLRPMNDLVSQLALCENGESVESVFVDGNPVIMNGALMTLDEREILAMLSALTPRIAQVRSAVAFAS
jgi:5-methylthioadenosine/S-adenosylhomocysteine deaminase